MDEQNKQEKQNVKKKSIFKKKNKVHMVHEEDGWKKKKRKRYSYLVFPMICVCILLIFGMAAIGYSYLKKKSSSDEKETYEETRVKYGNVALDFTGEGTTQIQTLSQLPQFDVATVAMNVEEVYVSSGNTVTSGSALMKLTDDCVSKLTDYYASAVQSAANSLTETQMSYSIGMLEAKYTLELTSNEAASADEVLSKSLDELDQTVQEKAKEYQTAQSEIEEYTQKLNQNSYEQECGLTDAQAQLQQLQDSLNQANEQKQQADSSYEQISAQNGEQITALQNEIGGLQTQLTAKNESYNQILLQMYTNLGLDTSQFAGITAASSTQSGSTQQSSESDSSTQTSPSDGIQQVPQGTLHEQLKITALAVTPDSIESLVKQLNTLEAERSSLQSTLSTKQSSLNEKQNEVSQAQKTVESAEQTQEQLKQQIERAQQTVQQCQSTYERKVEEVQTDLNQLSSSLADLQSDYEQAVREKVTKKVSLQSEYDQTLVEGDYAQSVYDATVAALEANLKQAQDQYDELQKGQNALLSLEGGVIVADEDGTIASVAYEEGDSLAAGTALVTYYDSSKVEISIEVSQDDIAQVAVGDTVEVSISGYRFGTLEGTVSSITANATEGASKSKVTYAVVVSVDNSSGMLSAGSSAEASFSCGTAEGVLYVDQSAVDVSGGTTVVRMYDDQGEVITQKVTVEEETEKYSILSDGVKKGDVCLIEVEGE